jgi:hypothetical protein
MTARPLDPESRRRPASAAVAGMLLLAMVMAAGCVSEPGTEKQTNIIQTVVTSRMIESTGTTVPPAKEMPFIIINPVDTHRRGDVFEINGTTNIGVDEKLRYYVGTPDIAIPILVPFGAPPGHFTEKGFPVFNGSVSIKPDGREQNHWSILLITSIPEFDLKNEHFLVVNVTSENRTIFNETTFDFEY